MKITRERLKAKGWSKSEIDKTLKILAEAHKKKSMKIKLLDRTIYWLALLLIIFGNFAFSTFLIPVLVTFHHFSLYFIVFLLAASFGVVMSVVVRDIENMQRGHHIAFFFFVPVIGFINFFLVVNYANESIVASALSTHQNPWLVGTVYLLGFIVPYSYLVFDKKWNI